MCNFAGCLGLWKKGRAIPYLRNTMWRTFTALEYEVIDSFYTHRKYLESCRFILHNLGYQGIFASIGCGPDSGQILKTFVFWVSKCLTAFCV